MLAQHCWGGQKRKVPENCWNCVRTKFCCIEVEKVRNLKIWAVGVYYTSFHCLALSIGKSDHGICSFSTPNSLKHHGFKGFYLNKYISFTNSQRAPTFPGTMKAVLFYLDNLSPGSGGLTGQPREGLWELWNKYQPRYVLH